MAGRPRAPVTISNNVMQRNLLDVFDCIPRTLYSAMNNRMEWLTWLAEHCLIRNNNDCARCQSPMNLVRRAESPDGYSWLCNNCSTRTSVRTGSFFANCVLSTEKIVMVLFYWVYEVKCKHVMLFEELVSWDTLVNYNNYFRIECHNWILNQQQQLGGFDVNGQPLYVEVDESYFFHRKYHRGGHRRGTWVVGLIERDSGRCWLEIVRRRDAQTLEQIIQNHVLPGTIIVTDAWGGYANVNHINNGVYTHEVVVHAHNFVDPVHAEIHTETIEGLWMQVKRKLRYQSGTSHGLFPSYLSAFQWRNSHKLHVFGQYLGLLSDNYNI
jgi:hypothetical protein